MPSVFLKLLYRNIFIINKSVSYELMVFREFTEFRHLRLGGILSPKGGPRSFWIQKLLTVDACIVFLLKHFTKASLIKQCIKMLYQSVPFHSSESIQQFFWKDQIKLQRKMFKQNEKMTKYFKKIGLLFEIFLSYS